MCGRGVSDRIVIIGCGNRDLEGEPWELTIAAWFGQLNRWARKRGLAVTLRHGAAPGADELCGSTGKRLGWDIDPHPAEWCPDGTFDPEAGKRRNQAMVDPGDVARCFAFGALERPSRRGHGLEATGTADMVKRAARAGCLVSIVPRPGVLP